MHQQLDKLDAFMNTVGSDLEFLFDASGGGKKEKKIDGVKLDLAKVEETNPMEDADSERANLRLGGVSEVYQDLKPPPENDTSGTTERREEALVAGGINEDVKKPEVTESVTSSSLLAKHNANIARLAESFGITLNETEQDGLAKIQAQNDAPVAAPSPHKQTIDNSVPGWQFAPKSPGVDELAEKIKFD